MHKTTHTFLQETYRFVSFLRKQTFSSKTNDMVFSVFVFDGAGPEYDRKDSMLVPNHI